MHACACLGPQFGEPYCECHMKQAGLERSYEYNQYYSEENVVKREAELKAVLSKLFRWENKEKKLNS